MKLVLILAILLLICSCTGSREPVGANNSQVAISSPPVGGTESTGNKPSLTADTAPTAAESEPLMKRVISFPQPDIPAAAKAVRASGQVTVQVTVSEQGKVVSASAITGHPLLKKAAVDAALKAEFRPLIVNGQPVAESGILTYEIK